MTATGRKTGAKRLFTTIMAVNRRKAPVYNHYGCVDVVHCNDDDSFRKEY